MRRNLRARLYSDSSILHMQSMKSVRGSLPLAFSQENSVLFQDLGYYAAMYEFAQGSFPKTLWESGVMATCQPNEFKLFIVNTPIAAAFSDFSTNVSTFISSFKGMSFFAIYFQIFDIDARGFTRPLMFVIAHSNSELISKVYVGEKERILKMIKNMQDHTIKAFPEDLKKYYASIMLAVKKLEPGDITLSQKVNELKRILEIFKISEVNEELAEEKPPSYFVSIKFDLRPAQELIKLDDYREFLIDLMSSMPKTITGANILCYSEYTDTENIIDFGGITSKLGYGGFSRFASKSIETHLTNVSQLMPRLLNSHVFYFIAFTLLSGQTLIIKTQELASTKSFAEKLTILCPFYKPSHMKITNSINVVDSRQYSIVITKDVVGDVKKVVSLLDLITGYYNGDGCPSSSFVNNVLIDKDKQNLSENTFMLHILTKLKEISSKFMFYMRKYVNYSQNPDELLNAVQSFGISKDDVPILKYWICCYYNKSNLKPILRGNHSKSGLTMTPF